VYIEPTTKEVGLFLLATETSLYECKPEDPESIKKRTCKRGREAKPNQGGQAELRSSLSQREKPYQDGIGCIEEKKCVITDAEIRWKSGPLGQISQPSGGEIIWDNANASNRWGVGKKKKHGRRSRERGGEENARLAGIGYAGNYNQNGGEKNAKPKEQKGKEKRNDFRLKRSRIAELGFQQRLRGIKVAGKRDIGGMFQKVESLRPTYQLGGGLSNCGRCG